jgi:tRNA pseudouridine13 synthase
MSHQLFNLAFPRAWGAELAQGVIKQRSEDFYVEELLVPDLSDVGEHVWLWIEKIGQNTEYVAEKIAAFARVKPMDVGFSGLKDRWAQTRQWFSVYLGNKVEPDWSQMVLEGVTLLAHGRHQKKLRRGEHRANRFSIRVHEFRQTEATERVLQKIKAEGFPNYFGPQRFGLNGANLTRGEKFFNGEIKASRSQRAFYLSAARSYLFNLNLADAIERNVWLNDETGGPLYGDESPGVVELSERERSVLASYPVFAAAIHKNRLKLERRPYVIVPQDLTWTFGIDELQLTFTLPSGCFATSLLAELVAFEVGSGVLSNE